jgi:hypothetical protein
MFSSRKHSPIPKLTLKRLPIPMIMLSSVTLLTAFLLLLTLSFSLLPEMSDLNRFWEKDITHLLTFLGVHLVSSLVFGVLTYRAYSAVERENRRRLITFLRSLYTVDEESITDYLRDNDGSTTLKYRLIKDHYVSMKTKNQPPLETVSAHIESLSSEEEHYASMKTKNQPPLETVSAHIESVNSEDNEFERKEPQINIT